MFLDLYGFSVDSCGVVGNVGEQLCFVEKNFVILTPHMISNCRLFKSTALMMLAIAASETSAKNENRPQPNSLKNAFNESSDSSCESLRQFTIFCVELEVYLYIVYGVKPNHVQTWIVTVKLLLEHGYLLMMNPPTNKVWYHSLPPRKNCLGVRVNLTFRKMAEVS